jgi:hypothetical protein
LVLGQKLVAELKLEGGGDTLCQWLAHDIADKMLAARRARGPLKDKLDVELRELILGLWKHRASLRVPMPPLESYDPVIRALESLDPLRPHSRFYPSFVQVVSGQAESAATKTWLDSAASIDSAARTLIRFCLLEAAASVPHKAKEWLKLASRVMQNDDAEVQVVLLLTEEQKALAEKEKADPNEPERRRIKAMHDSLKRLAVVSEKLSAFFDKRLADLKEGAESE